MKCLILLASFDLGLFFLCHGVSYLERERGITSPPFGVRYLQREQQTHGPLNEHSSYSRLLNSGLKHKALSTRIYYTLIFFFFSAMRQGKKARWSAWSPKTPPQVSSFFNRVSYLDRARGITSPPFGISSKAATDLWSIVLTLPQTDTCSIEQWAQA